MATAAAPARVPTPEIPNRLYFRIGDVSKLSGVKQHVLRFWETEFPALHPKKSGTNQRLYWRKDVELVLEIKHLLLRKEVHDRRCALRSSSRSGSGDRRLSRRQNPRAKRRCSWRPRRCGAPRAVRDELRAVLALLS